VTLFEELAARIVGPARVAIDGPDCAGKTTFAEALAAHVPGAIRASIDGFHRDRAARHAAFGDTPEGYYRAAFDLDAIHRELLDPLAPGGTRRYRTAIFDHWRDVPLDEPARDAPLDAVAIVDGVFLLRPELVACWELRVYLHCDAAEILRRAELRDAGRIADVRERYLRKYLPGQQLYVEEARPEDHADVVIDNTDPAQPRVRYIGRR
jgi:uridine kinase